MIILKIVFSTGFMINFTHSRSLFLSLDHLKIMKNENIARSPRNCIVKVKISPRKYFIVVYVL